MNRRGEGKHDKIKKKGREGKKMRERRKAETWSEKS